MWRIKNQPCPTPIGSCGERIILRTSSDVFVFNFGLHFWRVVLREVCFEGPNCVWRALKTSILNTGEGHFTHGPRAMTMKIWGPLNFTFAKVVSWVCLWELEFQICTQWTRELSGKWKWTTWWTTPYFYGQLKVVGSRPTWLYRDCIIFLGTYDYLIACHGR